VTARDLISASLRAIGAVASGESLAAQEATDGLAALNRLLSSWSAESLLVFTRAEEAFALVPGTASYAMGSGATFNSSRPQRIDAAVIRDETQSPKIESPVRILSLAEWAALRSREVQAAYPTALFASGSYPNETIQLYPVPSDAHKLVLWSWKPLTAIANLSDELALPPGYERALVYNLAIELAPEYGKPVSDRIEGIANEAKSVIMRMNERTEYLKIDGVPAGASSGSYDIFSGGPA
jgi:hypothetical protein